MPATVTIKCENCSTSITGKPDEDISDVGAVALDAEWTTREERQWFCPKHPPRQEPKLVGEVQECHAACLHFEWPVKLDGPPTCRLSKSSTAKGVPCRPWVLQLVKDLKPYNSRAAREAEMDL